MNTIIQIVRTIPSSFFYYKLNTELETLQTKKLALNTTSLFHASSTVALGINYLLYRENPYLLQMNTGGYLLFDLYYMLKMGKYDLLRFMYLYHHVALYPYMLLSSKKHYWPYVIFYAELSNIPNYIVYYSLKSDEAKNVWKGYKSKTTKKLLHVQMYIYSFFRVFILGYYTYLELKGKEKKPMPVYMTSLLYLFGLIWFSAMVKQNMK